MQLHAYEGIHPLAMDLSICNCAIALHKIDGVNFLFSQHCSTPMSTMTMINQAGDHICLQCTTSIEHLASKKFERNVIMMNTLGGVMFIAQREFNIVSKGHSHPL